MMKWISACLTAALLISIFPAGGVSAEETADLINRGNAFYRAGDYSPAIESYKKAGLENPDLYYNRGNAHFKNGELGLAVLYYIRASRIRPRDTDIRMNLDYARIVRRDRFEQDKEHWALKILKTPYGFLSINEHAALGVILFTLLSSTIAALMTVRQRKSRAILKNALVIIAIFLIAQSVLTGIKTYAEKSVKQGVLVDEEVNAFSAPSAGSEKVFVVHEGTEIRIERKENGFVLAVLPTGWTGWIDEKSIEEI